VVAVSLKNKAALKGADVLLITGGEPIKLRGLIGGGARTIRSFVHRGGGYVGVCAGAVLGAQKAPTLDLAQEVRCVDDNLWWGSGLSGRVHLQKPPPESHAFAAMGRLSCAFGDKAIYEGGPLLAIDAPKERRHRRLTRREKELLDSQDASSSGPAAAEPLVFFDSDVSPWRPDRTASRLPEKGEMSGKIAALATQHGDGRVVLSSIHPELSSRSADALLLEDMCLFAAGMLPCDAVPPFSFEGGKRPCPRCLHMTSKPSCRKCGLDFRW